MKTHLRITEDEWRMKTHLRITEDEWRMTKEDSRITKDEWRKKTHESLRTNDEWRMNASSKLKVCYDRRSFGQSVLVSSTHLGLTTKFLFAIQLRVCWCGALCLMRERVCRLQLMLVLASAVILRPESRGTRDHILLSQIRDSPNLEGWNRVTRLYPQALGSLLVASYDSQGYAGGIRTRLHSGKYLSKLSQQSP
jgi:hypothetical protein